MPQGVKRLQQLIFECNTREFEKEMILFIEALYEITTLKNEDLFTNVLRKILMAYEQKDFLLLADLLEYELYPQLIVFQERGLNHEKL